MTRGICRVSPETEIVNVPLADGGEGTVEAFVAAVGGDVKTTTVHDALGRKVRANWARLPDGTAVIEMAQASGLPLIAPPERDALRASSFGTGELIRRALDDGCRKLLVGVGGSATSDGGSGALQALGARFLDGKGDELLAGGAALRDLARIDLSNFDRRVLDCDIRVLCDVANPLCGERGAARVYAPQKGASPPQVELLDAALSHFANVCALTSSTRSCAKRDSAKRDSAKRDSAKRDRDLRDHDLRDHDLRDHDLRDVAGSGAAGGTAFGLMRFCNARLVSGIDTVLEIARFAEKLEKADLVLTGEGSIDEQTPQGKALAGVARLAKNAKNGVGVPIIAFGGRVALGGAELQAMGIASAFALADGPRTLEYSMSHTGELLENAVERALRLWLCARHFASDVEIPTPSLPTKS